MAGGEAHGRMVSLAGQVVLGCIKNRLSESWKQTSKQHSSVATASVSVLRSLPLISQSDGV